MNFVLIDSNPKIIERWNYHIRTWIELLSTNRPIKNFIHNYNFPQVQCKLTTIEDYVINTTTKGCTSIVTPTNSLSYMNGGFDKFIIDSMLLYKSQASGEDIISKFDNIDLGFWFQNYQLQRSNSYLVPNQIYPLNLKEFFSSMKSKDENHSILKNYNFEYSLIYKNLNLTELIQISTMLVPELLEEHNISNIFNLMWNLLSYLYKVQKSTDIENVIIPGIGTGHGHLDQDEVAKIMIFTIFFFNLSFKPSSRNNFTKFIDYKSNEIVECLRYKTLKKSITILFFLNKDYRKFENPKDIEEVENHVLTDYGKNYDFSKIKDKNKSMDIDELFKCIKF
ncbi:hypothetical protein KGF54_002771 [Candida jiufengensis]|uniref:uncharacterized protein n=1 Tax=Candida jiufengensis TaxID=497108 RepID=UPI002224532E|nr:uncharacterized protein KGF54_002771 [Candida jiufengensis]KAI5953399.1 hypothetical protein KGF54_002771 [Candida jiufengensis]